MSRLKCTIKLKTKFPIKCSICRTYKKNSQLYKYTGHKELDDIREPYPDTYIICEPCAMKEEFGNKWKQNKKYKKWKESK